MRRNVKVFVIAKGNPGSQPEPDQDIEVEAPNEDGLLTAAKDTLEKRNQHVRAISFTPTGLVAYAENYT